MGFPLGLDQLAASLGRLGRRTKIDVDNRRVAFFHRLLERDAPVIAAPTPDRHFVIFSLQLPFRVERGAEAAAALASLNRRGGVCSWSYDPERAAITVRQSVPIQHVEYEDGAVAHVVAALVDEAERAARELVTLSA